MLIVTCAISKMKGRSPFICSLLLLLRPLAAIGSFWPGHRQVRCLLAAFFFLLGEVASFHLDSTPVYGEAVPEMVWQSAVPISAYARPLAVHVCQQPWLEPVWPTKAGGRSHPFDKKMLQASKV